jgi:hypothetical protein
MASNPVWEICERMAEVQALLHDHAECGKHTADDVVAKAQAVLSGPELLRAMFAVGYFPQNTPPWRTSGQFAQTLAGSWGRMLARGCCICTSY